MTNLSVSEGKVSEELVNEINSITSSDKGTGPAYEPNAWTREGFTD